MDKEEIEALFDKGAEEIAQAIAPLAKATKETIVRLAKDKTERKELDSLQKIAARTGRRGPTWSVNDLLGRLVNEGVPQFCSAFHRDNKGANTRNLPRIKPSGGMDIDQLLDETRGER